MDDATKVAAAAAARIKKDSDSTPGQPKETFVAYMDESQQTPVSRASEAADKLTNSAKALDKWFRVRQKTSGAPRMLQVPNEALVTNAGPLQITGNITLVHENGRVEYANHLSLCRCGHTQAGPLCDESHTHNEFLHSGKIHEVSEIMHSERPTKITISCIKDGPITFRGRLRMHNQFGQECVKMRGSLCRCGHSTSKPFCDGSHQRVGFKTG